MRDAHTRDVMYYDCRIEAVPPHGTLIKAATFLSWFAELATSTDHIWASRDKQSVMKIRSISIDNSRQCAYMLICFNDGYASDASFAHLDSDEQRDVAKLDREGRPETAHVIFSFSTNEDLHGKYLILAEHSVRISRSRLQQFLNHLLREAKKRHKDAFMQPKPDGSRDERGQPKQESVRFSFDLRGYVADELKHAIENGGLNGLELVTEQIERLGVGETPRIRAKKKAVQLTPVTTWRDGAAQMILDALKLGRDNDYETIRVKFKTEDGAPHMAELDSETGLIASSGFVKSVRLTRLARALPEASSTFEDVMTTRMGALLNAHRG